MMAMNKLLLLALCLLVATLASAESQLRVRGAQLSAAGVKHGSAARVLKKEDKENDNKDDEVPEVDDKEDDKEDDEEEDEEPAEAAENEDTTVVEPTEEAPEDTTEGDSTAAEETTATEDETPAPTMAADEEFSVPLTPFSLSLSGDMVTAEVLSLEMYLEEKMKVSLPNLKNVTLEATVETLPEVEVETETNVTGNATFDDEVTGGQAASVASAGSGRRFLAEQKVYYEGEAFFVGPPKHSAEEVDAALTAALQDEEALMAYLNAALASVNATATVGDVTINDKAPSSVVDESTEEEEDDSKDGLSTTGLVIVIVAAAVGGIALLVIGLVGMTTGGRA